MTREDAKTILVYNLGSSETVRQFREEQRALASAKRSQKRLLELEKAIQTVKSDSDVIRACVDRIYGLYRGVLKQRYVYGYSWARISALLGYPDSSIRYWHDKGLDRLCDVFDSVQDMPEILERAKHGRK